MCEMCDAYDRHIAVVKGAAARDPEHRKELMDLASFLKKERNGSMAGPDDPDDPRMGPMDDQHSGSETQS